MITEVRTAGMRGSEDLVGAPEGGRWEERCAPGALEGVRPCPHLHPGPLASGAERVCLCHGKHPVRGHLHGSPRTPTPCGPRAGRLLGCWAEGELLPSRAHRTAVALSGESGPSGSREVGEDGEKGDTQPCSDRWGGGLSHCDAWLNLEVTRLESGAINWV